MTKKRAKEKLLFQATLWDEERQKAKSKKEKYPLFSSEYEHHRNDEKTYESMKQAILMAMESIELISEKEMKEYMSNDIHK